MGLEKRALRLRSGAAAGAACAGISSSVDCGVWREVVARCHCVSHIHRLVALSRALAMGALRVSLFHSSIIWPL